MNLWRLQEGYLTHTHTHTQSIINLIHLLFVTVEPDTSVTVTTVCFDFHLHNSRFYDLRKEFTRRPRPTSVHVHNALWVTWCARGEQWSRQ